MIDLGGGRSNSYDVQSIGLNKEATKNYEIFAG